MPFVIYPNSKLFFGSMALAGIWSSGSGKSALPTIYSSPPYCHKTLQKKAWGKNLWNSQCRLYFSKHLTFRSPSVTSLILADTKGKDINHHQQARKGLIVLFQDAQALRSVRAGHLGLVRKAIICTLLPISLSKASWRGTPASQGKRTPRHSSWWEGVVYMNLLRGFLGGWFRLLSASKEAYSVLL